MTLQHRRAGDARDDRGRGQSGDDGGHDEMLQEIKRRLLAAETCATPRRQPMELDRENKDGDQAQPIRRHADGEDRDEEEQPVDPGILLHRRNDPGRSRPTSTAKHAAAPVSSSVIQNFSSTSGKTGTCCCMEVPQSPAAQARASENTARGADRSARTWRAAPRAPRGRRRRPSESRSGSPGARWIRVKTIAEPPSSTGIKNRPRRTSNASIASFYSAWRPRTAARRSQPGSAARGLHYSSQAYARELQPGSSPAASS